MRKRFGDFLKPYVGKYVASVSLAIAGVFFGLVPYYIAYRLLIGFPAGYSYARIHTSEIQRIADYGISQGKEQLNDL